MTTPTSTDVATDTRSLYYVTALNPTGHDDTTTRRCLSMIATDHGGPSLNARLSAWRKRGFRKIEMVPATGIVCSVFRDSDLTGDYSNGGLSARYTRVTLVGPELYDATGGMPPPFAPSGRAPAVYLAETVPGHLVARPYQPDGLRARPMFGGTFIWTSDSRFRAVSAGPVQLHDRYE